MAQLNKAEEISAVWSALAAIPRYDEGWMTLPVAVGSPCILKAGRHFPGNEEAVLAGFRSIPSPLKEQLPEGKGFSVREVSLGLESEGLVWIALQRLPAGSLEMFTMMAADIISTLEGMSASSENRIFSMFIARIRAWQNFMQRGKEGLLGFESEVGLYGELLMLEALLDSDIPPDRAVSSWVGPCDGLQDFMIGTGAIEVKTTTAAGIFPAWISSLEQRDDSLCQPLFLAAIRICQIETGCRLPDMIGKIRAILQTASLEVLLDFDLRLLQAGYYDNYSNSYVRKFGYVGTRIIHVDASVPRLVRSTIPHGILRARYEIDIESVSVEDLSLEQALLSLGAY